MSVWPGDTHAFRPRVCAGSNASGAVLQRARPLPASPSLFSWATGALQASPTDSTDGTALLPRLPTIASSLLWLQADLNTLLLGGLRSIARWGCCFTGIGAFQLW